MAYGVGNKFGSKQPLFFFYDSEATDKDVEVDRIIEVAAVIHLATLKAPARRRLKEGGSHEFSSLCFSEREVGEVPQELTGLTKTILQNEPPLQQVLTRFFDWMETSLATASRLDHEEYTPVLVAHGGHSLDFPMLLKEVHRCQLHRKLQNLSLRYVETFSVFKALQKKGRLRVENMKLTTIYRHLFATDHEGHRALVDARALCRIFSDEPLASRMSTLLKFVQTREEMTEMHEQVRKLSNATMSKYNVHRVLAKGITYELMVKEYRRSPPNFRNFLRNKCGINKPKQKLVEHFRSVY